MKKILLLGTALCMLSGISPAQADSLYIGIGSPPAQPVYVAPPPAPIPGPVIVQEPVYVHPSYNRHHNYDWRYWHDRRAIEAREHHR